MAKTKRSRPPQDTHQQAGKKRLAPERLMLKSDWLRHRRSKFAHFVGRLWPESFDAVPQASKHTLQELDWAILELRKRRDRFRKAQPRRERGAQIAWDSARLNELLVIHDVMRTEGLKGDALMIELGRIFQIKNRKKIEEHLKDARSLNKK